MGLYAAGCNRISNTCTTIQTYHLRGTDIRELYNLLLDKLGPSEPGARFGESLGWFLIDKAAGGFPMEIMAALQALPEDQYDNIKEYWKAYQDTADDTVDGRWLPLNADITFVDNLYYPSMMMGTPIYAHSNMSVMFLTNPDTGVGMPTIWIWRGISKELQREIAGFTYDKK